MANNLRHFKGLLLKLLKRQPLAAYMPNISIDGSASDNNMLGVGRLLHKMSIATSLPDLTCDALKEEIQMDRARDDLLLFKVKRSSEVDSLSARLAADEMLYSVMRSSFTIKAFEECMGGMSPELTDFETELKREITGLKRKVLDLEADIYASEEKNKALGAEAEDLRSKVVSFYTVQRGL